MNKILKIIFVNILMLSVFFGINVYATEIPENVVVNNEGIMLIDETLEEGSFIPEEWRRDVTITDSLYTTDSYTSTNNTINENVFCVDEEEYKLNGKQVLGDMYIISDNVEIKDTKVLGNIFVITNNLNLKNVDIEGSIYVIAENVNIEETFVRNTIYMISENATINSVESTISDIYTITDKMIFKGIVSRDVCFYSQFLDIQSGTKINGNLSYPSDIGAIIDNDVVVLKETKTFEINKDAEVKESIMPVAEMTFIFLSFIVYAIILSVLLVFSKGFIEHSKNETFLSYFVKIIIFGFISMFIIFVAFLIICTTIVGIPIALILLMNMLFIAYMCFPIAALSIAAVWSKDKWDLYAKGLGVLLVLILLSKIPSITGSIFTFIIILLGFGTLFNMIFNKNKNNDIKDKKENKNVKKNELVHKFDSKEDLSDENIDILNRIDEIEDEIK